MKLYIGNVAITNLEDLNKIIQEKKDDYGFVTKIIDLFVDGDLEEFLRTCQNTEKHIELLGEIDKNVDSDTELFQQIAKAFSIEADSVQPNLLENLEFVGLQWKKFDKSSDFIIRNEYDAETKEQDVFAGLKVKKPIMESIGLTMQIKDVNQKIIHTIQSENCSLNVDKDSIVSVRFHINAEDFVHYRNVEIKQKERTIHSFCTYPTSIRIKVKNVWFSMEHSSFYDYEGRVPFLLWFVLMPKTTFRDERYVFYDVTLNEVIGCSNYEKNELVEQCINRLRNFTGLEITLKREISEEEREVAKNLCFSKMFFDPNDGESTINIKLSSEDYKKAIIENNDSFIMSDSGRGIIKNDLQITDGNEIKSFIKEMLNN